MDPLDPARRRDAAQDIYEAGDRAPASPPAVRRPDASLPRDLPDVDTGLMARAVRAATIRAPAPAVLHTDKPARDMETQHRLDDFRDGATPAYRTPAGDVTLPAPYRTAKDPALLQDDGAAAGIYAKRERTVEANRPALLAVAASVGIAPRDVTLVQMGRGSPEQIGRLTQALIDHGKLPAKVVSFGDPPRVSADLPSRVRAMMADHGIGIDSAGYAQQALLVAHGLQRTQTGLGDPGSERLTNLASRGFARVRPEDARSGDVVAFRSSERAIVYDRRDATETESAALRTLPGFGAGRITTWTVDAASMPRWSNASVDFVGGGVRRDTLWHDEATGQWARQDESGGVRVSPGPGPRGETLEGVYRPADRGADVTSRARRPGP
jgi:hypothetical protein